MQRERALQLVDSAVRTRIEMHRVTLDSGEVEALENVITDIQALINQMYDEWRYERQYDMTE